MEYEIEDEPQGLPDGHDGRRDGGLAEDRFMLRRRHSVQAGENERPSRGVPRQFEAV